VEFFRSLLKGVPDAEPSYRLITNWLDPVEAPAQELAALYHQRWAIESSFNLFYPPLPGKEIVLDGCPACDHLSISSTI